MTWEVASFLIVGAVVLAGFAWYERSRPPAQVVALVAALAALAIAGRIAFAAFPNVKPTTDIVIFAGYALGGAPGFAVGALAALVSNFWFGQGPWTPWQMAGWGLCGVLGAVLALGTRNAGRLTLAAICGFAGILYGALLNFSLMATYGGDLSLRHFLVLEARAIPFEVAHVLGNVALALVAGPAMVRMLVRFRERFEWERGGRIQAAPRTPGRLGGALRSGGVAALLVLALVALTPAQAQADSVTHAADWLESVQNGDGGFGPSASDESGTATTCWVMLGLEAAGRNPLDVASKKGRTPVDFLRKEIAAVSSPGDIARTILALEGAGADPRDFGGRNLVSELLAARRDNGSYHGWPNSTAFAVIALRAAGVTGRAEVARLAAQGAERGRRLGRHARLAQHHRRHRRGDAGALARLQGGRQGPLSTCATRRSRRAAGSRSAATAPSTRCPRHGRSRESSRSAAAPTPSGAAASAPPSTSATTSARTAPTATRTPPRPPPRSPTRRRSG